MNTTTTVQALMDFFKTLKGGSLVAMSHRQGKNNVVHLIVESRDLVGEIPDSWGRVILTLSGCQRCLFRPTDGSEIYPEPKRIVSEHRLALCGVRCGDGVCVVKCSYGLVHGTLEIIAESCSLMMGSGRTLSIDEFLEELRAPESNTEYARAS